MTRSSRVPFFDLRGGIKIEDPDTPFVVPTPPEGTTWTLLVLKAGLVNDEISTPAPSSVHHHSSGKEISHVILCYGNGDGSTTSSTTSTTVTVPSTTTTAPATTTSSSVPNSTTTTIPSTPSTVPPSTPTPEGGVQAGGGSTADGAGWLFWLPVLGALAGAGGLVYLAWKADREA